MKVLSTDGVTELIQLIKDNYIPNGNTVQTSSVALATVATTGAYSDLTGTPDPVQVSTLPTASSTEEGNIYQFVGTTDANYTNGYFYKCISSGSPATYSWEQLNVQPGGGGSLPSQTGNAGKFLTTDGTDPSWSDKPLVNVSSRSDTLAILGNTGSNVEGAVAVGPASNTANYSVYLGYRAGYSARSARCIAVGYNAYNQYSNYSIAIGYRTSTGADYAIQLGSMGDVQTTNSDANTFKVANDNGNFELMSADGTIPEARLADTTSATQGQVLTLDSNGNAIWQTPSGGGSSTLAGLTDTTITSPSDGQTLAYDNSSSKWVNKTTYAFVIIDHTA